MINQNFVYLAVILSFLGGTTYLKDTLQGKAQPNRVTWFLWMLFPTIGFLAEIQKGVGIQSLLTFMVGFNPALILIASFFSKKAVWKLGTLDYVCGAVALLALVCWQLTNDANVAILFSVLADGLAAVPTVVKSYRYPQTENYIIYLCGSLSAVITLLTIQQWAFQYFAFPLYIFLMNGLLTFFIVRKKRA